MFLDFRHGLLNDIVVGIIFVVAAVLMYLSLKVHRLRPINNRTDKPDLTDLRGEILELYFHKVDDIPSFPSHIVVVMKAQIVNHGSDEVTITHCGLEVRIGTDALSGSLISNVPDSWRIRKRNEEVIHIDYKHMLIEPLLGAAQDEIYRKGVPRIGWLVFEFWNQENIDFPNARFTILIRDSLGGEHRVERKPMLYKKIGQIVIQEVTVK